MQNAVEREVIQAQGGPLRFELPMGGTGARGGAEAVFPQKGLPLTRAEWIKALGLVADRKGDLQFNRPREAVAAPCLKEMLRASFSRCVAS